MKFYYITFRSVTFAQRGEKVLQGALIRCNLMRTPKWMEEKGCGYCLRLRASNAEEAVELLRKKQVPMRKVYLQNPDGVLEEITL